MQWITIEQLLEGQTIDCPPAEQVNVTFKRAPLAKTTGGEQTRMPFASPPLAKVTPKKAAAPKRRRHQ